MIKIKKNRFLIENKKITIETGLQIRILVLLSFSFLFLSFFLFPTLSITLLDGLILFKVYFISLLICFIPCWFLSDIKITFNANSKTIIKRSWFIKLYTIDFKSIERVQLVSLNNLTYFEMVLKKDPLGKHKIISPKYSKTSFNQKQLEEFNQKILIRLKSYINTKTI
ncbi:hypothetical protein SAMN05660313_01937 [Cellulophaga fucicola]|uniref:Uncharacterized protein n=1 Tax=Cellulophaga fucicola TaxID=76595 RepID=A0A1K1PM94_9FLAO|nr:hypothetical protein SAMN05660313_01937 [Cellulophaga fucicola]